MIYDAQFRTENRGPPRIMSGAGFFLELLGIYHIDFE